MDNQITNSVDSFVGKQIALASNKVLPVGGPILTSILWKYKYHIVVALLAITCFACFAIEVIALQYTTSLKGYIENIPQDHSICMQNASTRYEVEFELLASFGQVISNFDLNHSGSGKGFLELSDETWTNFGADGNDNEVITESDLCDNYFTLANKLKSIAGDSEAKIDSYNHPKKDEIKVFYNLLKGASQVPYGNPIGLIRKDLSLVTSGYNETRVIDGVVNVHLGVDFVPSATWFQENPGKTVTQAINRSIMSGQVSTFIDSQGALCAYVINNGYRILYCHCDSFIVANGSNVKYGDPICFLGSTGFSTGPHVHVEVYIKNTLGGWDRVDPTPFVIPN